MVIILKWGLKKYEVLGAVGWIYISGWVNFLAVLNMPMRDEFHKPSILISCNMPFYHCSPLICCYQFRLTLCLSVLPSRFAVEDNVVGYNCVGLQIVRKDDPVLCLKLRSRCVVMHVYDLSDMLINKLVLKM